MASKLAAYFINDKDGSPLWTPEAGKIRMVGDRPVLGLDIPGGLVRAVGSPEDRTLEFVGSDETVDRYREVLTVSGWDLKNYRQNNVFLFGHMYRDPSIGQSIRTWKDLGGGKAAETPEEVVKALRFHIRFAKAEEYAFADTIYKLYLGRYMRASSVGFLPFLWEDHEVEKGDMKSPYRTYTKHELLELSAVTVPANPSALVNALQKGVIKEQDVNRLQREFGMPAEREVIDLSLYRSAGSEGESGTVRGNYACTCQNCGATFMVPESAVGITVSVLCDTCAALPKPTACDACGVALSKEAEWQRIDGEVYCAECAKAVKAARVAGLPETLAPEAAETFQCAGCGEAVLVDTAFSERDGGRFCEECGGAKGVIPYGVHGDLGKKFPEGTAWAAPKARKNMQMWCMNGDQMDMGKYKKGFTWFDSAKPGNVGSYVMPHHDILDGGLAHHWRGSAAAMAVALGARGGAAIPEKDRRGTYTHLSNEYAMFEKEPPEYKDYVAAEDILSGAKDGITAYYLYCEVVGFVAPEKMPKVFLEKWPDIATLDADSEKTAGTVPAAGPVTPEAVRSSDPVNRPENTEGAPVVMKTKVRVEHYPVPGGIRSLLVVSPEFLNAWAQEKAVDAEWVQIGLQGGLAEDILICARSIALGRAWMALSEEAQAALRAKIGEGTAIQATDPAIWEHFAETLLGTTEKAGAVLNKRNLARIKMIKTAAEEVLSEAEPAVESTEDGKTATPETSAPEATGLAPEGTGAGSGDGAERILELSDAAEAPAGATAPAPGPGPEAEEPDVVLELSDAEAETLAPAIPEGGTEQGDTRIIEVDAEAVAEVVGQSITDALRVLQGDVRILKPRPALRLGRPAPRHR